jgi:GT2 family glycosyltransferase
LRASIIIPAYNGRAHLGACLPSVLAAITGHDEVWVVDDASSDNTASYVGTTFPQVKVLRSHTNLGFGAACNLGAKQAQGEFLVFLNQDVLVDAGWLEALVGALNERPDVGLVTSKVLLLRDPQRINTCGNQVHLSGLTLCRGYGSERASFREQDEVSAISGASFAMRGDLFAALGGFDPSFYLYMEDTDLSLRARLAGHRCLHVPQSIVYHDYDLRFGPRKTFYQERNRYLILLKTLRWRTLFVLLPTLLLAELVTWGFVVTREPLRFANKLRAYAWILRHWRTVMGKRRHTQTLRRTSDRDLLALATHRLDFEQTGSGVVARLAHLIFDPLFLILRGLTLRLV